MNENKGTPMNRHVEKLYLLIIMIVYTRLIAIDCITNMSFAVIILNWVIRDQLSMHANQVEIKFSQTNPKRIYTSL